MHVLYILNRVITSATLSILRGETVPLDVLQIKVRYCLMSDNDIVIVAAEIVLHIKASIVIMRCFVVHL